MSSPDAPASIDLQGGHLPARISEASKPSPLTGIVTNVLSNPETQEKLLAIGFRLAEKELGLNGQHETAKKALPQSKFSNALNAIKSMWWMVVLIFVLYYLGLFLNHYLAVRP